MTKRILLCLCLTAAVLASIACGTLAPEETGAYAQQEDSLPSWQEPPKTAEHASSTPALEESPTPSGQEPPEAAHQESPEAAEQFTPEPQTALTASEAMDLLADVFAGFYTVAYSPDSDWLEEEITHYGFLMEASGETTAGATKAVIVYAWVNSATGEIRYEESYPYASVPDSRFPVPMLDGAVIPYDYYMPPCREGVGGYVFLDGRIFDILYSQLWKAGFYDYGPILSSDYFFMYQPDSEAGLVAEIQVNSDDGSFAVYFSEKRVLSVAEAEAILINSFEGLDRIVTYLPDMDREKDGIQQYAFTYDFSSEVTTAVPDSTIVYVWVNSLTGGRINEESYPYANIPDSRFPVPMRNGRVIPYDYYMPPFHAILGGYIFSDGSVMETYQAQLAESGLGFTGRGPVMSMDSYWTTERDENGQRLAVEFYAFSDGSVFIAMQLDRG